MGARRGKRTPRPVRSSDEIRGIILQYFYDRNQSATSARGKKGYAVKISDVRRELKASYDLKQQEVMANLNYLQSEGWVEEESVSKSFSLPTGTTVPQVTAFYKITAAGIDKIEGPGEYTMDRFKGIRIEATGQNIITLGDGNQVNAQFKDAAGALVELKQGILESDVSEADKLEAVGDIDSIEAQLAKAKPNGSAIRGAWEGVKTLDTVMGLGEKIAKVSALLAPFLLGG